MQRHHVGRRALLAGAAATFAARRLRAQPASKPRVTVISQWTAGPAVPR